MPQPTEIRLPGDKSISHRVLLLTALAKGPSFLKGLNEGEDVKALIKALQALGVPIDGEKDSWRVEGVGKRGLKPPVNPLDLGNSGTALRLLMGVLAAHPFATTFSGDASLSHRPLERLIRPLSEMGVIIQARDHKYLPLTLKGVHETRPAAAYVLPFGSAQIKSALLLAHLQLPGKTRFEETVLSRDHTERLFGDLGIPLTIESLEDGRILTLEGDVDFKGKEFLIPRDPSAAAFFAGAAVLLPDQPVFFRDLLWNPFRNAFFSILKEMGAHLFHKNKRLSCGEELVDFEVTAPSSLRAVETCPAQAPSLIDEYPILACVAACASGRSLFRGLGDLRHKESDRLEKIHACLTLFGIKSGIEGEDLWVEGDPERIQRPQDLIKIDPGLDHRIAMAFSILAIARNQRIRLEQAHTVNSSFPSFWDELRKITV